MWAETLIAGFFANGVYQLPWDAEIAGNVFGRQGNPLPIYRAASLGLDGNQRVLISPALDDFRFKDTWNVDLRLATRFAVDHAAAQLAVPPDDEGLLAHG